MTKLLTCEDFGFADEAEFKLFIISSALAKVTKNDVKDIVEIDLPFDYLNDNQDDAKFYILKKGAGNAFCVRITFNEPEETLQ